MMFDSINSSLFIICPKATRVITRCCNQRACKIIECRLVFCVQLKKGRFFLRVRRETRNENSTVPVADKDCSRDMSRLQGCNPFTLTNISAVKLASRPETPANDAFELLKPQTVNPNVSTTPAEHLEWAHRQQGDDDSKDRRFDHKRFTSSTQGYGHRDEDRYPSNRREDKSQMVKKLLSCNSYVASKFLNQLSSN
jgi:hypothetical protein